MIKAVLVTDTRSLFYGVKNKFQGQALSYLHLVKMFEEKYDLKFLYKFAFGKYEPDRSYRFFTLLKETGFDVTFDRKHYDAELALKVAKCIDNVEAVVLATCWFPHYPVLEFAKEKGKFTYLLGVNIPYFANYISTPLEIDESLLRKKEESTSPQPDEQKVSN